MNFRYPLWKSPQVSKVFNSPEQVIGKLIQNCYDDKLQEYIRFKLLPLKRTNTETYLIETFKVYQKTTELSETLSKYRPGSDSTFTKKLQKSIFNDFTERKLVFNWASKPWFVLSVEFFGSFRFFLNFFLLYVSKKVFWKFLLSNVSMRIFEQKDRNFKIFGHFR